MKKNRFNQKMTIYLAVVAATASVFTPTPCLAGLLIAPGMRAGVMSFEDKDGEPTPNYYGIGGALSVGYSVGQKLDLALFGQYSPGKQKRPVVNEEDATLFAYGGEIGGRFSDRVYFAVRGGSATYNLLAPPRENEINGKWSGPAFGFSVGAYFVTDREGSSSWQATLDVLHAIITPSDPVADAYGDDSRRITCFSFSLTYVLNKQADTVIENLLFKGFLESAFFKW